MQTITIEGNVRSAVGKAASKATRKKEMIPCVIYSNGEVVHLEVSEKSLRPLLYTPNAYKVIIGVDGKQYETVIREVQMHPVTDAILHVDFFQLTAGNVVAVTVPVKLEGNSTGVRAGGKLVQKIRKISIKGLPEHLIDSVVIDVTELEVGKSIRIGDIRLKNLEVLGAPAIPVVTCIIPRALKSAMDAAATEAKKEPAK
ncbi:MAG: 50S ribosomal protein L25 [Chitinophagales bacterium]